MSGDSSPALIIRLPASTTAVFRDRLVALLADHDLVAIQEDDVAAPRVWTAHFASHESRRTAAAHLHSSTDLTMLAVESVDVADEDWARRTQADLPAIRVGRIIVAPPWDVPDASDNNQSEHGAGCMVVEIEPSRGFGTGHHQSTRLCLALLQNRLLHDRTMVDVGTGSGVLAIVAAKLGARFVSAIDVDPDAIENARENIDRNHVTHIVEAHVRDVSDATLPAVDVVTANLTGRLLARHARHLVPLLRPGGILIAAGFTVDEKELVTDAFTSDLALTESAEEDDWWAFVFTRPG